jgi:uncharacterized surface protein with fasciclin (FAS1) repeats
MKKISLLSVFFLCLAFTTMTSCSEKIDDSNLYTFTGETVESYIANRDSLYGYFHEMLKTSGHDHMLATYGTYTVFLPDNQSMVTYLDSLAQDNNRVTTGADGLVYHNGIVDKSQWGTAKNAYEALMAQDKLGATATEKKDSLCKDITEFHIITSSKVKVVNMTEGATFRTYLGRNITTSIDANGRTKVNVESAIVNMDIEVENGIIHTIDHVLTRSNRLVGGELERHPEFSLMLSALKETGLIDSLSTVRKSHVPTIENTYGFYVPKECLVGYTLFLENNDVLAEHNIKSFDDLVAYANETYGQCAAQNGGWYDYARDHNIKVSTGDDYTNRWNALNMFVRYHIIKEAVPLNKLTISFNETDNGKPIYEYYETMLPYTLMKVTRLNDNVNDQVINRWETNSSLTDRATEAKKMSPGNTQLQPYGNIHIQTTVQPNPLNGYIYGIGGMLTYAEYVPHGVLNERMRFDDASLFPEMMTNGFRGISNAEIRALNNGKTGSDGSLSGDQIRFPDGYFDNMKIYNGESTHLYYLSGRSSDWSNYQGDEFNCLGAYDFAFRLPPVPDGTYELRIGYTANNRRGMLQFYLGTSSKSVDMEAIDIPLDMRLEGVNPLVGWGYSSSDYYYNYSDNGLETDKSMRNRGYMRGPLAYWTPTGHLVARANSQDLRRIVARREFRQGEYWLRFKTVLPENTSTQFHLDYIEFCPSSVYNNPVYNEDMY